MNAKEMIIITFSVLYRDSGVMAVVVARCELDIRTPRLQPPFGPYLKGICTLAV